MRALGMLLIWIGGGLWLYQDLSGPLQMVLDAMKEDRALGMSAMEWLELFVKPIFVLGVICAVGMPALKARPKKGKKGKKTPAAGGPAKKPLHEDGTPLGAPNWHPTPGAPTPPTPPASPTPPNPPSATDLK